MQQWWLTHAYAHNFDSFELFCVHVPPTPAHVRRAARARLKQAASPPCLPHSLMRLHRRLLSFDRLRLRQP